MTTEWNPRYVAYSAANGASPEEMLLRDEARFPGGKMAGFMCWISGRWTEYTKLRGFRTSEALQMNDPDVHANFNAWLTRPR